MLYFQPFRFGNSADILVICLKIMTYFAMNLHFFFCIWSAHSEGDYMIQFPFLTWMDFGLAGLALAIGFEKHFKAHFR